jgi:hypothetical protein
MSNDQKEVDWRKFASTFDGIVIGVAMKHWSKKASEGKVCMLFGCLNEQLEKCSYCEEYYCDIHMPYHKTLCQIGKSIKE